MQSEMSGMEPIGMEGKMTEQETRDDLRVKAYYRDIDNLNALANMGKLSGELYDACLKSIVDWYNAHAIENDILFMDGGK